MKEGSIVTYAEKNILFIFECESVRIVSINGVSETYVYAVPGSVIALHEGYGEVVRDAEVRYPYYACRLAFPSERREYARASVV